MKPLNHDIMSFLHNSQLCCLWKCNHLPLLTEQFSLVVMVSQINLCKAHLIRKHSSRHKGLIWRGKWSATVEECLAADEKLYWLGDETAPRKSFQTAPSNSTQQSAFTSERTWGSDHTNGNSPPFTQNGIITRHQKGAEFMQKNSTCCCKFSSHAVKQIP